MHHDGVGGRPLQQLRVHLVGREQIVPAAHLPLAFVGHGDPGVGHHAARAGDRCMRVRRQLYPRARAPRPIHELGRRGEFGRGRDAQGEVEPRGGLNETLRDIVAVAGPGDHLARDGAAMLLEGHHVGHQLAGMRHIGEAIDHRHGRVFGQLAQLCHAVGAQHDRIDIARQHARRVGDTLATAKLHLLAREDDGVAAELADADLERHARAGGGLFEDQRDGFAGERLALDPAALGQHAKIDHAAQRGGVVVHQFQEVPGWAGHARPLRSE